MNLQNNFRSGISRAALEGQASSFRDAVRQLAGSNALVSEQELARRLADTLAERATDDDIWIFAYGSLVWNPIFPVAELRAGELVGYERAFCMDSTVGRGSPERPGLMLALDVGGSCAGVVLRMARDARAAELPLLWRREMLTRSYRAIWAEVRTDAGPVTALTFVADRKAPNYVGHLPMDETASRIAAASGLLGGNLDYLADTHAGLARYGIEDPYLTRLLALSTRVSGAEGRSHAEPPSRRMIAIAR